MRSNASVTGVYGCDGLVVACSSTALERTGAAPAAVGRRGGMIPLVRNGRPVPLARPELEQALLGSGDAALALAALGWGVASGPDRAVRAVAFAAVALAAAPALWLGTYRALAGAAVAAVLPAAARDEPETQTVARCLPVLALHASVLALALGLFSLLSPLWPALAGLALAHGAALVSVSRAFRRWERVAGRRLLREPSRGRGAAALALLDPGDFRVELTP
jgi:hypothetical protein